MSDHILAATSWTQNRFYYHCRDQKKQRFLFSLISTRLEHDPNLPHLENYIQDLLHLICLYQQQSCLPAGKLEAEIDSIDLEFVVDDLPKVLTSMRAGAERIREIVRSLRTFSRLDEAELKSIDLHDSIDSTLMILQHRLNTASGSAIQVIKHYGELPLIECYAGLLNQVLMSLLVNAIDALESCQIAKNRSSLLKTITLRTKLLNAQTVLIQVADNGSGMTEQVKAKLFDPFFTTKEVGQGTGLGLAISHQIITKKHKGEIKCFSKPGQGAKFQIKLPVSQLSE